MSGLQKKLSLGFGGLLLIILAIGIQSILYLTKLGESIDVILRENYRSVVACQEMKDSLEEIDSGMLFIIIGDSERGKELISRNINTFERALQAEENNITLQGEAERVMFIKKAFQEYKTNLRDTKSREAYFIRLHPLFQQIKHAADEVLRMNQENMNEANDRARNIAANTRRQMYALLLAGTILSVVFFLLVSRWILRPINRLIKSADEIGRGNLDLVVQSSSRDEIGHLSEAFSTMAANLREFRRSDQAKLFRIQHATQKAFDSLPDSVAVLDFEGRAEVSTELAREAFGIRPNTVIYNLQIPLLADIFEKAIKFGRTAVPENGKTIIQRFVKGDEKFFRPEAVPILDREGQATGVVLVLKDVTQFWQQDEMKRGIISTVSHQLKTPLTSIRMAIHLMLEEKVGTLTEKQVELLLAAREDSDRLHTILNNLLDISRIESGRASIQLMREHPHTLVLNAVERFTHAAHDKGVNIRTDVQEGLPEVWVDPVQIGHVFSNLLTNALRYTDPGGVITVSARKGDNVVCFGVSDTGRGIPAEYLDKVFEQFFRVPDQDRETGSGLGLSIVKEIVDAQGGTIRLESEEGKGTTFTFTLKQADKDSHEGNRT